ncbi:MAG TPA: MerR family transcriptional regulator [Acidimicrobiales bacterium]|nr:MerR family transcriptional regulator [Acidimicrobiales bacterium]
MPVAERAHLSIGEVLALLQEEFPDITISKIRFLESQGLLDPERTPSGYRKFYEPDIERLRWILRQQRENFLPLRVIKDRLQSGGAPPAARPPEPSAPAQPSSPAPTAAPTAPPRVAEPAPRPAPAPTPAASRPDPVRPPLSEQPPPPGPGSLDSGPTAVSLTRDELANACGLHERTLAELERYGLITGRPMGRDTLYDEEALVVARLAASFMRFGVEARHLRMYKVSAEREASFFEQVVLPLVKQRNPAARQQAVTNLGELTSLGESLRAAMLRQALRSYTG